MKGRQTHVSPNQGGKQHDGGNPPAESNLHATAANTQPGHRKQQNQGCSKRWANLHLVRGAITTLWLSCSAPSLTGLNSGLASSFTAKSAAGGAATALCTLSTTMSSEMDTRHS